MRNDVNASLRSHQRAARNYIETIRLANGSLAADYHVGGLMLAIAEYMTDWHGRRAAYDYIAGFADDLLLPEGSDERR